MNKDLTLKSQAEAVIHFIQHLDIEMVDTLLDNSIEYQDMRKDIFISKFGHAMNEFIEAGDTFLNTSKGFCDSIICNYKCSGFSFVGNNSGKFIDLIIEIEEGKIVDIYECTEFKTKNTKRDRSKRIEIDKLF